MAILSGLEWVRGMGCMSLPFRAHPLARFHLISQDNDSLPGGKTMCPSKAFIVPCNRVMQSNSAFSRASVCMCMCMWNRAGGGWVFGSRRGIISRYIHSDSTLPFSVPLRLSHGKRTSKCRVCWAPGRDIEGALRRRWLVLVLVLLLLPLPPANALVWRPRRHDDEEDEEDEEDSTRAAAADGEPTTLARSRRTMMMDDGSSLPARGVLPLPVNRGCGGWGRHE